jgi:hypothetical protein
VGDRVHLPRALIGAVALLAAGCIDFVAPDLPQVGGPAVFEGALRVRDDGPVRIDGELAPGIDEDGIRRRVPREAMIALDDSILPTNIQTDGTRRYLETRVADASVAAGPLSLEAPVVAGVDSPPAIRWIGIVRVDPDTLVLASGSDLVLRTFSAGTDVPAPLISSWTLQLRGGEDNFRIGANGAPPALIQVPARWLPRTSDGLITAELGFLRRHSVGVEATSYVGIFLVDVTLHWTIRLAVATSAGEGRE